MNRLHAVAVAAAVPVLSLLLAARPAQAQYTYVTVQSLTPADGSTFTLDHISGYAYQKSVYISLRYTIHAEGTPNTSKPGSYQWSVGFEGYAAPHSAAKTIAYNTSGKFDDSFDDDGTPTFYSNGGHHTAGSIGLFYESNGSMPVASQSLKAHDPDGPMIPFVNDWANFTVKYPGQ